MSSAAKRLKILRLDDIIIEGSAPYHQFTLPWTEYYDMTFCVILKPTLSVPEYITVFEGNGSVKGTLSALKKALNSQEFDIVHVHSPHTVMLYVLLKLFMWNKVKFDRTIYTLHNSFPSFKLKHKLMFLMGFALFKRIVCCGQASFQSVPKFYRLLAGKRLNYVTNGANIERVEQAIARMPRSRNKSPHFHVVIIGRLTSIKEPFIALEVFDRLEDKDSRLLYISKGTLQEALLAKIKEKGLTERVTITGDIARNMVFEYLADSDVYLSTSRGEGLPVAPLEAMASKCPVILSDIAPHREIADGADFIPLVPLGDVPGFVREIEKLQKMRPKERTALGQKCYIYVKERFSLETMRQAYDKVYLDVIKNA